MLCGAAAEPVPSVSGRAGRIAAAHDLEGGEAVSANPARVRATPFHARAAEANETNAWAPRNGFTLSRAYAGTQDEALAARFRAGLIDISWRWRVHDRRRARRRIPLAARHPRCRAARAGQRGQGAVAQRQRRRARRGRDRALRPRKLPSRRRRARCGLDRRRRCALRRRRAAMSPRRKAAWRWSVPMRRRRWRAPASRRISNRSPSASQFWRGLDITLSRLGEQNGFEIWCAADDAIILWDRLMRAGAPFGIEPIGLAAADFSISKPASRALAAIMMLGGLGGDRRRRRARWVWKA